jgi:hypothetical protein
MPKKSSGCGWFIIASIFGLLTLIIGGGGGYAIWHTSSDLAQHKQTLDSDQRELDDLMKARKKSNKSVELMQEINHLHRDLKDDELYRNISYGVTAGSICPATLTLLFALLATIVWLKARKSKDESNEN